MGRQFLFQSTLMINQIVAQLASTVLKPPVYAAQIDMASAVLTAAQIDFMKVMTSSLDVPLRCTTPMTGPVRVMPRMRVTKFRSMAE